MRIDAHHHLWRYKAEEFDWIDDRMQGLRRDFLWPDLQQELRSAEVDGTIVVQARQTLEETEWLLTISAEQEQVMGVVGWAPMAAMDFADVLSDLCRSPQLKGLRHVVQAEASGFLDSPQFNAGLQELTDRGLVYDLLIKSQQIPEAIRFVDRHPNQMFVVDHLAKPDIASHAIAPWAAGIRDLALRQNVLCKVSGMVTEANWEAWSLADLQPYLDVVLECFGTSRLMAGSDWPVLRVACGYRRWWDILERWTTPLSETERNQIQGEVAARVYRLDTNKKNLGAA